MIFKLEAGNKTNEEKSKEESKEESKGNAKIQVKEAPIQRSSQKKAKVDKKDDEFLKK